MGKWKKIGSAGNLTEKNFQSGFDGTHRYKVPPGLLIKDHWNEIIIRNFSIDKEGGFLGDAPSIQGYFLECILSGSWNFFDNGEENTWKSTQRKTPKLSL